MSHEQVFFEKKPPFIRQLPTDKDYINKSRKFAPGYLGWQLNRKFNPFFVKGTGHEGFFIRDKSEGELQMSSTQVLETLLDYGKKVSDAIIRLHPYSIHRSDILKTLQEERWDPEVLNELYAWHGAILGVLRAQHLSSPTAAAFREETAQLVKGSEINYGFCPEEQCLKARYTLPQRDMQGIKIDPEQTVRAMTEKDFYYWQIISALGKMGDPLIRTLGNFN